MTSLRETSWGLGARLRQEGNGDVKRSYRQEKGLADKTWHLDAISKKKARVGYRNQNNVPLLQRRMRGEEAFVSSGHFTEEGAIMEEVKRCNGRGLVINAITSVGIENHVPAQAEDRRGSAQVLDSMWCGLPCLPLHLACKKSVRTMEE